ncbi:MAG: META domain-containing protein [Treponema sp.]|nr:META domain-containing protein [Treponema sp.]
MKKAVLLLFITFIILGCAGTERSSVKSEASEGGNLETVNTAGIINVQWNLIEVYIDGNDTQYRRAYQPAVQNDLFILKFDGKNISGTGAPNRFSAPYTMGEDQTLAILPVRSTRMASLFEPENLSEHDFFTYVQNTNKWRMVNGNLELLSITGSDLPVRMVFMVYR